MEMSIAAPLEVQEYLFAGTSANYANLQVSSSARLDERLLGMVQNHIRGALRCHRFTVMTWLMSNGVSIPVELLADQGHPFVGNQLPDRPVDQAK